MEQKIINKLESLGINVEEYDIIDVSENYKFLQGFVCFLTKKFSKEEIEDLSLNWIGYKEQYIVVYDSKADSLSVADLKKQKYLAKNIYLNDI
jgi:hypothetical protein